MSKITLFIEDNAKLKLKEMAKQDDRSFTKYLERGLIYLANIPGGYHTQPTQPEYVSSSTQTVFTSPARKPGVISAPQPEAQPEAQPEKDEDPIATITEMEKYMSDPDNEYYQKIKNYFLYRDKYPERLVRLLNLAEENNLNVIAGEFEYAVQKALDIPITKSISRSEWKEIITYLK